MTKQRLVWPALWLISALLCMPSAQAAFAEMTLSDGYRVTVRHDEVTMKASWRPYGDGAEPRSAVAALGTVAILADGKALIAPAPGSQAVLLEEKAYIAVAIDMRDQTLFFDQLAALRIMLATADFSRQRWLLFDAAQPQSPFAQIASEAQMAQAWQALRERLRSGGNGGIVSQEIANIAPIISQLAIAPGDRKALVVPQSLAPTLAPGLTPQGIAGLQAFGISLFPLTRTLKEAAAQAYVTLAKATGGHTLPWLDIPPAADVAAATFRALLQGGTSTYTLPKPPWQPWKTPAPLSLTLVENSSPLLALSVPRQPSEWSTLPWAVIAGLAALFILCAGVAAVWLRRQGRTPLRIRLTDLATQKQYEIPSWPATLGRSDKADITIANAHLQPFHVRFSDNGTGMNIRLLTQGTYITVNGQEAREHSVYKEAKMTLESLVLRVEFLADSD